ncbi:zinc ribbon domain-containing protein [Streptomyces sp. BE133]|uniref:zinc ribbon domain-containing protein n=1 Tax=Streptomyces sp. BE133 TaxID=3002523 RepID=UPI002E7855B8|nr:zinc ribbon domain-containing protein [Streptomyces sp. BE133]MEE1809443.1 zinc ribbon domain-containing protein [Streptomyces sp. BE133]
MQAHPGGVDDEGRGLFDRAGGGLGVLAVQRRKRGGLGSRGQQLVERAEDAAGRVGLVEQLAQRLGEELGVDGAAQFVLDLLEGELHDADGGTDPVQAGAGAAGHRVVALVVAMSAARTGKGGFRSAVRQTHFAVMADGSRVTSPRFLRRAEKKLGRTLTKVDRAFPSSQVCSTCGYRDGPKPLHIRAWTCSACGTRHDRDHNAGQNIKHEGRRIRAAQQAVPPTPGPGALARQRTR